MAAKAAHEAAQAKAARQKKVLLVLVLPLGVALFYAYHTVSKLHQSPAAAPPAAATTSGSPASTAASTTTSATAQTAPPAAQPVTKLTSFARLPSRNPFSTSRRASTIAPVNAVLPGGNKPQHKSSPPPTSAVIALDRTLLRVRLHGNFGHASGPARQPLFRVVALTHKTAKIVVLRKGRRHAYTLQVDAPRILGGPDRNLYALMLLPQGTPVPAAVPRTKAGQTAATAGSHG